MTKSKLEEKRVYFCLQFVGKEPIMVENMWHPSEKAGWQAQEASSTHRKQRENRKGWDYKPSKPAPSDILPPAWLHLLKIS